MPTSLWPQEHATPDLGPLPTVQGSCSHQGPDDESPCTKKATVYARHGRWKPYCLKHADRESSRIGSTRYARAVGGVSNPLPGLRLGVLGSPYHEPLRPHEPPAVRVAKFLDYLQHHLLHAHGAAVPTFTHAETDALRAITGGLDIEMHAVWPGSHPFEAHPVIAARRLHRASQAILHAHHRIASEAGMATYTIQPPLVASMALDEFAAEVGSLRDMAREEGLAARLHVANGAPVLGGEARHLDTAGDLVDFARANDVTPTLHAGHLYATMNPTRHTKHALDEDAWRGLLRPAGEALVVYASSEYDHHGSWIGAGSYTCEEEATPGVRPLLRALLAEGGPRTLLVEGPMPEADALSVMHEAGQYSGFDPAPALKARTFAYSDHTHEMRFAVAAE